MVFRDAHRAYGPCAGAGYPATARSIRDLGKRMVFRDPRRAYGTCPSADYSAAARSIRDLGKRMVFRGPQPSIWDLRKRRLSGLRPKHTGPR